LGTRVRLGKPTSDEMARTVFRHLGAYNGAVLVGPKPGVDVSVISLGRKKVLIGSSDPLSLIPRLGPSESAKLSVQAIASDVASSGNRPRYAFYDLNLPPALSNRILEQYWKAIHESCKKLGVAIVGGHTGRFEGIDFSIVGAGTMLTVTSSRAYVTSSMARPSDDLIATKSAALEAAGVLSRVFPKTVKLSLGERTAKAAANLLGFATTVDDSLAAASVGLRQKVTAMHDVTEGGVFGAVSDLAVASGLKATIDQASIPLYDEALMVCKLFRIDPYACLGQGCLLIASRPYATESILHALRKKNIKANVIGHLSSKGQSRIITRSGKSMLLSRTNSDPYWRAYWNGVRRGLN
jgi:hydrogenase maturation factor